MALPTDYEPPANTEHHSAKVADPRYYRFSRWEYAPPCPECGCLVNPVWTREQALKSPAMACANRRHDSFRFAWGKAL